MKLQEILDKAWRTVLLGTTSAMALMPSADGAVDLVDGFKIVIGATGTFVLTLVAARKIETERKSLRPKHLAEAEKIRAEAEAIRLENELKKHDIIKFSEHIIEFEKKYGKQKPTPPLKD